MVSSLPTRKPSTGHRRVASPAEPRGSAQLVADSVGSSLGGLQVLRELRPAPGGLFDPTYVPPFLRERSLPLLSPVPPQDVPGALYGGSLVPGSGRPVVQGIWRRDQAPSCLPGVAGRGVTILARGGGRTSGRLTTSGARGDAQASRSCSGRPRVDFSTPTRRRPRGRRPPRTRPLVGHAETC